MLLCKLADVKFDPWKLKEFFQDLGLVTLLLTVACYKERLADV